MKKNRKVKIGYISQGILSLVAVAGVISVVAVVPGVSMALAPFLKKRKYSHKQAISRNIDSLIKNGLLKKTRTPDGSVTLQLTTLGKWEVGIRGLEVEKRKRGKWDSLWRIVIFDVSEKKARDRQELRRALTLKGFKPLQKSVWVYPYPCENFLHLIKKHLSINADVLYLTANYIENDTELRREFSL